MPASIAIILPVFGLIGIGFLARQIGLVTDRTGDGLSEFVFASGVGAVFGIVVMIRQRKGRDTQIAFGPFLAIAGWIALVAGDDIVTRYLNLFARAG